MGALTSFAAGAAERNPDHCGAGGVPYPGRLVTASSTGPVTGADLADEAKQATTPHQITHAGTTILAHFEKCMQATLTILHDKFC